MKTTLSRRALAMLLTVFMMLSMYVPAYAASKIDSNAGAIATPGYLLTTSYGSAGPDFLGVTNTNHDFLPADLSNADNFNRLAIWGTGVNENANPYYQNLLANSSSNTSSVNIDLSGIIDSTNIWTQMYSMSKMAAAVDSAIAVTGEHADKFTRYDKSYATATAINYERAIKGQMLYVASYYDFADGNVNGKIEGRKKKIAYLYAIQGGTAYFFVPGTETNGTTAADNYVSNNATINMGYMAVLPFVTDTFDSGHAAQIVMTVGDIQKSNPACIVTSEDTYALKDVDVIIYNTSTKTGNDMIGTDNGRNSSDVYNTNILTAAGISEWASAQGLVLKSGVKFIAGDDYGTGTNQNPAATSSTGADGAVITDSCPILYCSQNYTVDKNARAAWIWSKVFPELYNNNDDATYGFWLEAVYHIKSDKVASVLAQFTHQNVENVNLYADNANSIIAKAEEGYSWYQGTSNGDGTIKANFAYYTDSKISNWTVGIFAPSNMWDCAIHSIDDPVVEVTLNGKMISSFTTYSIKYDEAFSEVTLKKNGINTTIKAVKLSSLVTLPGSFCSVTIGDSNNSIPATNSAYLYLIEVHENDYIICSAANQESGTSMWVENITSMNVVTAHSWTDGVCSNCSKECIHTWGDWSNSQHTCSTCSKVETCSHTWGDWSNSQRTCSTCSKVETCSHIWGDWSNSQRTCSTCSKVETCTEHSWNASGKCTICGKDCSHTWGDWSNSQRTCSTCSKVETCTEHSWNASGTCTICGKVCGHDSWNAVTDRCSLCGRGRCSVAGFMYTENGAPVAGDMTDTADYVPKTKATLVAPLVSGYNFVGWYKYDADAGNTKHYTGEKLYSGRTYKFTVTDDAKLVAVYKAIGSVSITINGGGANFSINGSVKTSEVVYDYQLGSQVTVVCNSDDFEYWRNSAGLILSREKSYTFTVTGSDIISAVRNIIAADQATVAFESFYGQVVSRNQYLSDATMTAPSIPYRYGYTGLGWDYNGDGVFNSSDTFAAALTKAFADEKKIVKITPVYQLISNSYTITVENGIGGGSFNLNDKVTLNANAPETGMKFSHWKDENNTVLSYNQIYQFFASKNTTVTAVYVDESESVDAKGMTQIIETSKEGNKMIFVSMSTVPNLCTIDMAGIIATDDSNVGTSGEGFNASTAKYVRGNAWSGKSFRFTWTKLNVASEETWYVRAYLVYTDAEGTSKTVYGPMVSQTM